MHSHSTQSAEHGRTQQDLICARKNFQRARCACLTFRGVVCIWPQYKNTTIHGLHGYLHWYRSAKPKFWGALTFCLLQISSCVQLPCSADWEMDLFLWGNLQVLTYSFIVQSPFAEYGFFNKTRTCKSPPLLFYHIVSLLFHWKTWMCTSPTLQCGSSLWSLGCADMR